MSEIIKKCFERGCDFLKPGEDELSRGLKLHAALDVCDSFGFLPRITNIKTSKTLVNEISRAVNLDDIIIKAECFPLRALLEDDECQARFKEALRVSGVKCTVLTAGDHRNLECTLDVLSWQTCLFDNLKDTLVKAVSAKDLSYASDHNKLAVIWSANGAPAFGGIPHGKAAHAWIERLHHFGIRVMHLTYNRRNWIGDGCLEPANGGLSLHGRDVVKQFNQLGLIIDTAHSGIRTTIEAAELSEKPVVATHTACRGLYNHPRGKTDDALKAIAASGGYIGICLIPYFLGKNASINTLLDHIEYAVNLAGLDHVGIGSDTCWSDPFPAPDLDYHKMLPQYGNPESWMRWFSAWEDSKELPPKVISAEGAESLAWTNWPLFTVGLVKRGYSKDEIAKLVGGNFIRVFREICP